MRRNITLFSALLALALVPAAFAANTVVTSTVFPARTVPGGTITIHNTLGSAATQPVKATITVTNPGQCVSSKVPGFVGALSLNLQPGVLRTQSLSLTTPAHACAGTYTVKITVVNTTTNTTLASHTTTFTISPGAP